jgi:hypothetical protein
MNTNSDLMHPFETPRPVVAVTHVLQQMVHA